MNKYIENLGSALIGLVVALIIILGARYALAWTGPSGSPPANNVTAPLNVSSNGQIKDGGLTVGYTVPVGGVGFVVKGGNVGIGTVSPAYTLDVVGNIQAGAFFYSSDKNLKKNIAPLQDSLSKIQQLQGVSFNWKDNNQPNVGLIAQDVEKVYPELVSTNPKNGMKSVEYANLVSPLIEAVKAQQKEIDELKAEIKNLKENK